MAPFIERSRLYSGKRLEQGLKWLGRVGHGCRHLTGIGLDIGQLRCLDNPKQQASLTQTGEVVAQEATPNPSAIKGFQLSLNLLRFCGGGVADGLHGMIVGVTLVLH